LPVFPPSPVPPELLAPPAPLALHSVEQLPTMQSSTSLNACSHADEELLALQPSAQNAESF
jgi:hypothetical protein